MDKQTLVDYIEESPYNMNKAILNQMLDEYADSSAPAPVQSDWLQSDENAADYIKNKPGSTYQQEVLKTLVSNWGDDNDPPVLKSLPNTELKYKIYLDEDEFHEDIGYDCIFNGENFVKINGEKIPIKITFYEEYRYWSDYGGEDGEGGYVTLYDVYLLSGLVFFLIYYYDYEEKMSVISEEAIPSSFTSKLDEKFEQLDKEKLDTPKAYVDDLLLISKNKTWTPGISQPDYGQINPYKPNFIKNRIVGKIGKEVVTGTTKPTFSVRQDRYTKENYGYINGGVDIPAGETIKMTALGNTYYGRGVWITSNLQTFICYDGTIIPYELHYHPNIDGEGGNGSYTRFNGVDLSVGSEFTVTLEKIEYTEEIQQLPEEYIPDTIARTSDLMILNSSTEGSTKKFRITVDDSGTLSAVEI